MTRLVPYREAIEHVRTGDILLLRAGWWPHQRVIAAYGRSIYCHAAMIEWRREAGRRRLMVLEMTAAGGRQTYMKDYIERYPARCDFYAANFSNRWPHWRRDVTASKMREFLGRPYGWRNFFHLALRHLPGARLLVAPDTDDLAVQCCLPVCSSAIAEAVRAGGVDPVPRLSDRFTEPGDLERSMFYQPYQFTIVP